MASSMRGLISSGADIDKNDEEFYLRHYRLISYQDIMKMQLDCDRYSDH